MIAVDTNVLVRFLVEDDEEQSRRAADVMARALAGGVPILIPEVVLVETAWVLSRSYRRPRGEIAGLLRQVVSSRGVVVRRADAIRRALANHERGPGGFADYLLREQCREQGCGRIATFDRALLGEADFFEP
jgi:predicted nucleic-acid-binding protein